MDAVEDDDEEDEENDLDEESDSQGSLDESYSSDTAFYNELTDSRNRIRNEVWLTDLSDVDTID
jgi:hypothetical protein